MNRPGVKSISDTFTKSKEHLEARLPSDSICFKCNVVGRTNVTSNDPRTLVG